jgi:polyketide synthase 12/myxalamid-type polyketide synthase MxaB
MRFFADARFKPLPLTAFSLSKIPQAFQELAQGKHIGKFAISLEDRQEVPIVVERPPTTLFRADSTYLITGGLGGLGLTIAQWMIGQGAKTLVLTGRTAPSEQAQEQLTQMQQAGAQIHVLQADVADKSQISQVISFVRTNLPILRGVFHAAGVLDDRMLLNMDLQNLSTVMRPKLLGAYHLHTFTQQDPLDYFVLFSSAASLLGSPGQGNYAAANALLDSLAHYRRAKGLAALSINWGPWADVGLAAAQASRGKRLATLGISTIAPQQGVEALGELLSPMTPAQVAVIPLNMRQWRQSYPAVASLSLFADLQKEQPVDSQRIDQALVLRASLQAVNLSERQILLEHLVREQVAQVLRLSPAKIDRKASFKEVGLESLLAVELRNRLENKLSMTLPVTIIWAYPMIHLLAEHLAHKLDVPPEAESSKKEDIQHTTNQTEAHDISEVNDLPEENVTQLLLDELQNIPVEFFE